MSMNELDFNLRFLDLLNRRDDIPTWGIPSVPVNSTLAVSNIRNRTYTNYEVYLIGYGYGKFKEKIHFME